MPPLSERERAQLKKATRPTPRPPALALVAPRFYIEFASFAARFDRSVKPVRFIGYKWKL